MAEPYTPYPTVPVAAQPPVNASVRSSPAAFGGAVGQADERLGAGLLQAGDTGLDVATRAAELQNQSTSNKAFADFNGKVTDLLYKPASAQGEEDGGFFTKQGYNAGAAAETTRADLQKLFDEQRAGLTNVRQQIAFDTDARRVLTYSMRDIGSHAVQQIHQADDATMNMGMSALTQEATQAAQQGDFKHFDEVITSMTGKALDYGHARGYGSNWGQQWSTKAIGQTVGNAAKQLADSGPDGLTKA